jgi:purine nucleosidase
MSRICIGNVEIPGTKHLEAVMEVCARSKHLCSKACAGIVHFEQNDRLAGVVADSRHDMGGVAAGDGKQAGEQGKDAERTHKLKVTALASRHWLSLQVCALIGFVKNFEGHWMHIRHILFSAALILLLAGSHIAVAQHPVAKQKVILDTDIGDDIDDAFALALAFRSPELQVLQIDAGYGDTPLRARLLQHLLRDAGLPQVPVAQGVVTPTSNVFTQRAYAEQQPSHPYPDAIKTSLDLIRKSPGEITLIAIAPLSNIGAMIDRDPATFRKLKRVVLMGGSIHVGYDGKQTPEPEWNIKMDIASARKLFASGVPIFVMPLDATNLKLDAAKRQSIFTHGSRLTDQLAILYHQWGSQTPTLFDAMAVAYAVDPALCPTTPMRLRVEDSGMTIVGNGAPNANVCLRSNSDNFFRFYLPRLSAAARH